MESPGVASLEKMPVGYRFRPTEQELLDHYLKNKLLGDHSLNKIIAEVDVCKVEPWDLPAFSKIKSGDQEWFFFSPRDLKYTNSNRSNRATKAGYWKVTGKDRKIKTRGTNIVIGTKKTLVFYGGRSPHGVKTKWVIHEYHTVGFDASSQRDFVLCRLMEKAEKKAEEGKDALINHVNEPSNHMDFDSEDPEAIDIIQDFQYSLPEVNLETIFRPEEYDFPLIQQEPSFPSYNNVNRNSNMDFPVKTIGEEDNVDQVTDIDKFLISLLTSEDVSTDAESSHAFVSNFASSESLKGTDTELLWFECGNILGPASSLCNEHGGSREFQVNNITEPSHGARQAGTSVLSSHEVNQVEKESIFQRYFQGVDTSSNDLPADNHILPILSLTSIPSHPAPSRSQTHGKVASSRNEVTTTEGVDTSSDDLPAYKHYPSICVITRVGSPSPPALETEKDSLDLDTDVEQNLKSLIIEKEYDFPFPPKQQEPYSPPAPRRCKTKYHSRTDKRSAATSQVHRKVSSKAATAHEVKKGKTETQELKKDQREAEGGSSRKKTGSTSNGGNRKGSFIPLLGTSIGGNRKGIPLLGLSPRPRTVCNINEMVDRFTGFSIEDNNNHRRHHRS